MPSAEKRRRQKENRARALEEAERTQRSESRRRTAIRVGIAAVLAVGLLVLLNVLRSDNGDDTATTESTEASDTTSASDSTAASETTVEAAASDTTVDAAAGEARTAALAAAGCENTDVPESGDKPTFDAPEQVIDPAKSYTATIETTCGPIVVELDAEASPTGVNNFVFLADQGFYDGLTWHRVVSDFVIQGGDPDGTGAGGPGYSVVTETPENGYEVGDIAYAKAQTDPNGTAGSQFFLVTGSTAALNQEVGGSYQYGSFGHITEGLDVAQTLESFDDGTQAPTVDLYINSITITES